MEKIEIVFENEDFLVINKPAGVLVHAAKPNQKSLVDWLIKHYPQIKNVGEDKNRPGIVHRLDRDTSGLLIIAKTNGAFFYFKNLFQRHQIKKGYIALVYGKFNEKNGLINKPIGIVKSSVKHSTASKDMKNLKEAVTEYEVVNSWLWEKEFFSLVKLFPKTGRTHQIRVHLASIGHPVVGDPIYGRRKNLIESRLFLHAFLLEFNLKNDSLLRLESDLPDDLKQVLKKIGGDKYLAIIDKS